MSCWRRSPRRRSRRVSTRRRWTRTPSSPSGILTIRGGQRASPARVKRPPPQDRPSFTDCPALGSVGRGSGPFLVVVAVLSVVALRDRRVPVATVIVVVAFVVVLVAGEVDRVQDGTRDLRVDVTELAQPGVREP